MRKSLIPVLVMLFVLALTRRPPAASAAAPPKLFVDPAMKADMSLIPGSSFTINVNISDVLDLYGYEFKLSYQTSVLTATSITLGSMFPVGSTEWVNIIDDAAGVAWYSVSMPFGSPIGVSGNGTLAVIAFTVDDYGSSYLVLYDTLLGNSIGTPIVHDLAPGYFANVAMTFEANLVRRSAWPECHHYVVSKDADGKITLYGKVKNTGTVKTVVKVVFDIYDGLGNYIAGIETPPVMLEVGEIRDLTYDWDGFATMKYHPVAHAVYDSDGDTIPDTNGTKMKSFSFTVVP